MTTPSPRPLWRAALRDGGLAGLTSLAALAVCGRLQTGSAAAPINAPSHWIWGDRALRQDGWSLRYTATGLAIHQGSAVFWGLLHQWLRRRNPRPGTLVRDAIVTSAAAAFTDLALTPPRLTPGFEQRLSPRGLAWTYALFAVGLAVASHRARTAPRGRSARR
jgi:hypothetical protein